VTLQEWVAALETCVQTDWKQANRTISHAAATVATGRGLECRYGNIVSGVLTV
jgi:hypothetical protein